MFPWLTIEEKQYKTINRALEISERTSYKDREKEDYSCKYKRLSPEAVNTFNASAEAH